MVFIKRRNFLSRVAVIAGAFFFYACRKPNQSGGNRPAPVEKKEPGEVAITGNGDPERIMNILEQRVNSYMAISHNCAQSSFLALKDQFNLEAGPIVKALTPLPGLGDQGQTCGAITGCLMALGLVYGNEHIDDWKVYRESLIPAGKFCDQFKQKYGSFQCSEIHKIKFGKSFKLTEPEELAEFQAADGTRVCSEVVCDAVKMAAMVILKSR